MKVYLVSSCHWAMVGIEKCQVIIVYPAQEAAFVREYGGRILTSGIDLAVLPPIPISVYKGL